MFDRLVVRERGKSDEIEEGIVAVVRVILLLPLWEFPRAWNARVAVAEKRARERERVGRADGRRVEMF